MIEFGILSIALGIFSKAWNKNVEESSEPEYVSAVLSVVSGLASTVCLIIALITAPWGSLL